MNYCEISLLITDSIHLKKIKALLTDYNSKIQVLLMDESVSYEYGDLTKIIYTQPSDSETSIALLVHTSGSLSKPKRVALSHKNLLSNAHSIIESLAISSEDITLIAMPLQLISAITSQMLTHLLIGATLVIMDLPFVANNFYDLCEQYQVSNFTCVPSILNLLTMRRIALNKLTSLRTVCFGGAPTPNIRISELITLFPNIRFVHMYGQTEASPRLTHLLPDDLEKRLGSVGKPLPGVTMIVVDKNGNECEPLVIGEICAKGDNIMVGYYKNPQMTNQILINGWLHTGDLGYMTEDGFFYIVGRIKNIIISGGENIYPEEVEEVLLSHSNVLDALVYPTKDVILGEVVCAKVVLKESMSADELRAYCKQFLKNSKIPKHFTVCTKIDRTASGKVIRGMKTDRADKERTIK